MSIKAQLLAIELLFNAMVAQVGGAVFICSDLVHLWQVLFDNSQGIKILLMFNGEQVRGDLATASPLARVDRQFLIVVSRGRSMGLNPGDAMVEAVGNAPPMFEVMDVCRDWVRGIQFDPNTCEMPVDYHGMTPFHTEGSGRIVDAYQIMFSVGTQLLVEPPPGNDSPGQGSNI